MSTGKHVAQGPDEAGSGLEIKARLSKAIIDRRGFSRLGLERAPTRSPLSLLSTRGASVSSGVRPVETRTWKYYKCGVTPATSRRRSLLGVTGPARSNRKRNSHGVGGERGRKKREAERERERDVEFVPRRFGNSIAMRIRTGSVFANHCLLHHTRGQTRLPMCPGSYVRESFLDVSFFD